MQRVVNNGSFLQAYAMKKIIENMGHNVEFVDFHIGTNEVSKINKIMNKKRFAYYLKKIRELNLSKIKIFASNLKVKYNFKNKYFLELGLTSKFNYNPNLDILLFGSDEVFNTIQYVDLYDEYVWELYGANNNAKKLVSYAASFGHTTYENLKLYNMLNESKKYLSQFDEISVRDYNSQEIIKKILGNVPEINIDPVLLYDYDDVDIFEPKIKNYILIYAYPGRIQDKVEINKIKEFAKKQHKKLICVNMLQPWCDEMIYAHPLELLGYFKYADYVITDTFHGAVLSIKYGRSFAVYIRSSAHYSNNQKISYLLSLFNLKNRIIDNKNTLNNILEKHVDWKEINRKIMVEKEKAFNYLNRALTLEMNGVQK